MHGVRFWGDAATSGRACGSWRRLAGPADRGTNVGHGETAPRGPGLQVALALLICKLPSLFYQ